MSRPVLDITRDVCPMTTVKVGMALARLAPGEAVEVRLREEALKNVVSGIKASEHRIALAVRQDEYFVLHVEKGHARGRAQESAGSVRPPRTTEEEVRS